MPKPLHTLSTFKKWVFKSSNWYFKKQELINWETSLKKGLALGNVTFSSPLLPLPAWVSALVFPFSYWGCCVSGSKVTRGIFPSFVFFVCDPCSFVHSCGCFGGSSPHHFPSSAQTQLLPTSCRLLVCLLCGLCMWSLCLWSRSCHCLWWLLKPVLILCRCFPEETKALFFCGLH